MAKLVFGMNVSLDGYVDHDGFGPGPALFAHFIAQAREQAGSVYGRRLYEIMRYWDEDHPEWDTPRRDFAHAWRAQHKWVVSRTLTAVGPNATLIDGDLERAIRRVKDDVDGEVQVGGPVLAGGLGALGLIDAYRLYLHPVVLGQGTPYFAGKPPPLRLDASDLVGDGVIRLTYVPV